MFVFWNLLCSSHQIENTKTQFLVEILQVSETWMLGEWMCVTWTSSDVLSCTGKIV